MVLKTANRYIKVYGMILRLNWARLFAYRANLINSVIAHTLWASFVIIGIVLLTAKVSVIHGWTRNELLVLSSVYNIVYSVFYLLFSRSFGEFANTMHFGRLDGIVTKPIDSQFLITCLHVSYTQIVRFLIGLGFLIVILTQMQVHVTVMMVIGFVIFLLFSVIIIYSFTFAVMTLTVWFTNLSNLMDLLFHINHIARYPQEMYKGASNLLFLTIFPLTLVIVIPSKVLLQKMLFGDFIWPIVFAIGMFYLSRKFWQFALKSYTSASG